MNAISTSLADIDVRIKIFSNSLPKSGVFAARKALARVAQAEHATLAAVPAAGVVDRFEGFRGEIGIHSFYDERNYLRRALELPEIPNEIAARIHRGEPTVADAVAMTLLQEGWGYERGRIISALKRFAGKLQSGGASGSETAPALDAVPANLGSVDKALDRLTHAHFGFAENTFGAFKSRIRRAVRLVDIHARTRLSFSLLGGEWQTLLTSVGYREKQGRKSKGGNVAKIWPLLGFCYRRNISPRDVDDEAINDLVIDMERRGRKDPFAIARSVVYGWQVLQKSFPLFPQQEIGRLYREGYGRPYPIPFERLPEPFRQDWASFTQEFGETPYQSLAEFVENEEIEDEYDDDDDDDDEDDDEEVIACYSAQVLGNMRTTLTYAANVAIESGLQPMCIEDVITPEILKAVIKTVKRSQREKSAVQATVFNKRNGTLRNHAMRFVNVARDLGLDEAVIDALIERREKVDPKFLQVRRTKRGEKQYIENPDLIGPRHRARLEQFKGKPVLLARWYGVMTELLRRCQAIINKGRAPTPEQVNDMIACALHAITRTCLFRRKNIANMRIASIPELGINQNLVVPASGQGEGTVHIPADETKNYKALTFKLPVEIVSILRLFIDHFRPALMKAVGADPRNPYLFPMAGMGHRDAGMLNRIFVSRNWDVGGFVLNLHVQRHMGAKIILDQDPTKIVLVQTMLGHKRLETTQKYYAEINDLIAQAEYLEIFEAARQELLQTLGKGGY